jgi:hypothetical protein
MIQPNELRIGNWINNGEQNVRVSATAFNTDISNFKPIPLTEEIFEYIPYSENVSLDQDDLGFYIIANEMNYDFSIKEYPYLHQLQNLYFALIKEELKINNFSGTAPKN